MSGWNGQAAALAFIADQQAADGGFVGMASQSLTNFRSPALRPTTFYASLIMTCLHDVPGSETIRQGIANYLLANKSDEWTWNYWQRDVAQFVSEPYPDDLDDTACALAALTQYEPALVDGAAQGHFAQTLIAQESQTGGPYNTWLHNDAAWCDIDVAVNANIAFCLKALGVTLPALTDYIETAIVNHQLASSYYVGAIPSIYFIARWYDGPHRESLAIALLQALKVKAATTNPLLLAMALSSACRLGADRPLILSLASQLRAMASGGHWQASAIYYEPPTHGKKRYAGSPALTTAFAIEALQLTFKRSSKANQDANRDTTAHLAGLVGLPKNRLQADLRTEYEAALQAIAQSDNDGQITAMADCIARACGEVAPDVLRINLNLASLHGWLAYTIYDDVLDNQAKPERLGAANLASRKAIGYFATALPDQPAFQALVQSTFDVIDGANTWEVSHARGVITNGQLTIKSLPDYGNLAPLWQRSAGHMLAMRGTLLGLGHPLYSHPQQRLSRFFKHFIIAKQLNDDAHDWEEDLSNGHLSPVVCQLLSAAPTKYCQVIDLKQDLAEIQRIFWETTILAVCDDITYHLELARRALLGCGAVRYPDELLGWLDELQAAVDRAIGGRQEAKKFIDAYAGSIT
jgi:hypothetical protein